MPKTKSYQKQVDDSQKVECFQSKILLEKYVVNSTKKVVFENQDDTNMPSGHRRNTIGASGQSDIKELFKAKCRRSIQDIATGVSMTLLEKAITFREENPEKWESRRQENDARVQESYGIYEDDPFLSNYYQRLEEIHDEDEKLEEQRKHEPPQLTLTMEFNLPKTPLERVSSSTETYASLCANCISIYDKDGKLKLHPFKTVSNEERGKESELIITVSHGNNFNNILREHEARFKECNLHCQLHPENNKRGSKTKTSYTYCNLKGMSKWDHAFVLKGFTAEELFEKHVVLEAVGKNSTGKQSIGEVTLAGKNASICEDGTNMKFAPTQKQCCHWQEALEHPGTPISFTVALDCDKIKDKDENIPETLFRSDIRSENRKSGKTSLFKQIKNLKCW